MRDHRASSALYWIALLVLGLLAPGNAAAVSTTPLDTIPISENTGEKPQSKAWYHADTWWVVLPNDSPPGTWVWRLEPDGSFTSVLSLSSSTVAKADVVALGDVTHVLLCDSSGQSCSGSPQLVSIEYDEVTHTYQAWSARPAATPISLPGSETSTLELDSTGRMWIATTNGGDVDVLYSDPPYTSVSNPITLNPGNPIDSDDISLVTTLAGNRVGVLWSNQNDERFGFREHLDADPPNLWSSDEVPASQSALNVGRGMSDDHLNVALAGDGTLFAAVKTGYDSSSQPKIAMLVRHPDGTWDDLHEVDNSGTRPIVLLNHVTATVQVLYASDEGGGDILLRESPIANIQFGSTEMLMQGNLDNVTSTKGNWSDEVLVLASDGGTAEALLMHGPTPPPPPAQCADGVDNDGDGLIDHPEDPSCIYAEWDDESSSAGILLAEDFSTSPGPFSYRDDAFNGTAEPNHADGAYEPNAGVAGGALSVAVGANAVGTSGGWAASFVVLDPSIPVDFEIRYRLFLDGGYEPDEYADALFAVDGVLYGVPPNDFMWRLVGDGSTDMDSGWVTFSIQLSLVAGSHELVVGVFNNESTTSGEVSTLLIDTVSVTAPLPVPVWRATLLVSVLGIVAAFRAIQTGRGPGLVWAGSRPSG